jgi:head-tail adaptor
MRAGTLDKFVTVMRKTTTYADDGQPLDAWAVLGTLRRPANVGPVAGEERRATEQVAATEQTRFRLRYSEDLADLSPLDRIIYPAMTGESSPEVIPHRNVFDIIEAPHIGRLDAIEIVAIRRTDT